ncbi:hypothetical protein ACFXG4_38120 [Nocardia sp. NPDC059246]|uniref:hypothetical protein n=1 Tax=Nocardia sp. NPDC059246 TaxID=3346789 RepID=UPI0036CF2062
MTAMNLAVPEILMLCTSAASATCCVGPRALASLWARGLAATMFALMGAMVMSSSPLVVHVGVPVLLLIAAAVVGFDRGETLVRWHRVAGAAVMAAVIVLHHEQAHHSATLVPEMPLHHHEAEPTLSLAPMVVTAATAAYVGWTTYVLWRRSTDQPWADPGTWEHLMMAACLGIMTGSIHG